MRSILLGTAFFFLFSKAYSSEALIEQVEAVFRYGTYQEQLEILDKHKPSTLKDKWKKKYIERLNILIENADEPLLIKKLIGVIWQNKLKPYYAYFEKTLEADFLGGEIENRALYQAEALYAMAEITNTVQIATIERYLTNEDDHLDNETILRNAVRAVGVYKLSHLSKYLKTMYQNASTQALKEEILRTLGSFGNQKDLPFLEEVIFEDGSTAIEKWVAVVALKNFKDFEQGFFLLKRAYQSDSPDIKARALYAMSFYRHPELKKWVLKGTRDNNAKIRYQAILGLEQYQGSHINALLTYKAKNDAEPSIRKAAKEILKKRGAWEEEKK